MSPLLRDISLYQQEQDVLSDIELERRCVRAYLSRRLGPGEIRQQPSMALNIVKVIDGRRTVILKNANGELARYSYDQNANRLRSLSPPDPASS